MLTTGTALFLSESVKCYYNQAFWVKITTFPWPSLFTFTSTRTTRAGGVDADRRTRDRRARVDGAVVHGRRRRPLDWFLVELVRFQ